MPCPIGTYNDALWQNSTTAPCTACGYGLTTAAEGSDKADQCSLCVPGYGASNGTCQGICGGVGALATYGPPGRNVATDPSCIPCSTQATGYSFEWNKQNDLFQSLAISKDYANSSLDCVAELGQLMDGSWYIPINTPDPNAVGAGVVANFAACANQCKATDNCEFVVFDYLTNNCTLRMGPDPIYVGAPLIGFKNLPSGDVGTNSWSIQSSPKPDTNAKMVTTGTYTFYRDEQALIVGNQIDPPTAITAAANLDELPSKLQECLNQCDEVVDCAGITIRMNVLEVNRPTTCKLIKGERKLGVFKRTVVRAVPTRMPLPSLRDLPDP